MPSNKRGKQVETFSFLSFFISQTILFKGRIIAIAVDGFVLRGD